MQTRDQQEASHALHWTFGVLSEQRLRIRRLGPSCCGAVPVISKSSNATANVGFCSVSVYGFPDLA